MTTKRSRRERAATGDLAWWEKLMFSFMGPPQLGDNRAREGYTPDPRAELCAKCGQPWERHERVHASNMTYTRCRGTSG